MAKSSNFDRRTYFRDLSGGNMVVFDHERDRRLFDDAVKTYTRDGDRGALMRNLMAIGMPVEQVRWHVEHRGEQMIQVTP